MHEYLCRNGWDIGNIMEEQKGYPKHIEKSSDAYNKRTLKLLGHPIRADNAGSMRQVALKHGSI